MASDRRRKLIRNNAVSQAQVDESDAARSRAEAGVSPVAATVEAQPQRQSMSRSGVLRMSGLM
jgi:membrane fusion protein (multidrug efflux system)